MSKLGMAVIFDFDGTIFSSVKCHEICWQEVVQAHGEKITREQFESGLGVKNERFVRDILHIDADKADEIVADKEELFRKKSIAGSIKAIPETLSMIRRLHAAKIQLAIGSASGRANIDRLLGQYPDIYAMFSVFITAEDLEYGKPNPEVFLKAAERLGCLPKECLVIEDTPSGIIAAKKAGMKAIGLTTTLPKEYLKSSQPDLIVATLEEVSVEDVVNLVHG